VFNGKTLKGELLMWAGRGGLAPPTFQFISGKMLSYGPKTVYEILTDSSLPA